jgi:SAM-dependent methyltransferase
VVELGTGWNPVQPIAHFLCGAGLVETFDIEPLLHPSRVARVIGYFRNFARDGRLAKELPALIPSRLAQLDEVASVAATRPPAETLAMLGIRVHVADARHTGLEDASADFLFSHSVFEYVPRDPFTELMREFRRVARPGAVTSHYIRLSDQYHHFDHALSQFNFLRFTARQWRWFDSPIIPQSRLRISDCREIFKHSGWRIFGEENTSGSMEDLQRVPLAPEFQSYRAEDLLVVGTWLAAD